MTVLMFLDGVMRKPDNSPIMEGVRTYQYISERERVVILCDDKENAEWWFKTNNLSSNLDDFIDFKPVGDDDINYRRVDYARSRGKIDYVITSDIELALRLLESGIVALLFLHPKYIRPEFRPDKPYGVKKWENIISELDRQQNLYSNDARLKPETDLQGYE